MQFENGAADTLLAVLPPLIHVKGRGGSAPHWLESTLSQLLAELEENSVYREPVIVRLADVLFIQAIRAYFTEHADQVQPAELAALRDPRVGRALALLHSQPGEQWTVGVLARRLALSRSAFAERFSRLLGEPPRRYLARLRLNVASERLRDTDEKISLIAVSAGYRSLSGFSRAFKHERGVSPVEYRRNRAGPSGMSEQMANDPAATNESKLDENPGDQDVQPGQVPARDLPEHDYQRGESDERDRERSRTRYTRVPT